MPPPLLKKISGLQCVKLLCKHFGFRVLRQKGSHIILVQQTALGRRCTVVPDHAELKVGTLKGILEMAGVEEKEFAAFQ